MAIRHNRWLPFLWPAGWLALGAVCLYFADQHPWLLVVAMPALVLCGASLVLALQADEFEADQLRRRACTRGSGAPPAGENAPVARGGGAGGPAAPTGDHQDVETP